MLARDGSGDPVSDPALSWERTNLSPERAAALLALGDGLAAIGRLRTGRRAGQLSIFNFRLRAAGEGTDGDDNDDPGGPLTLLMGAGVLRRHTFFCRYTPPVPMTPGAPGSPGLPCTLALPGAIDGDWDWWPGFEEVRGRIIPQPVWLEAVGAPYAERLAAFASALAGVRLIAMDAPRRGR